MASDVTGSVLRGFGVPYILTPDHLWADKATYTQQGPTVGQAVPQGSYTLALQTSGAQSASKELRAKIHRGGSPGPNGAEVIYQYNGDSNWRGFDVQQTSAYQVIRTTAAAATSALSDPDACSFYDTDRTDKVAVVYQRQATGPTAYNVECAVYDPSDGSWSSVVVYASTTSPTDGYHPTVTYNRRDGYIYVAHWIYDTDNNLAQVTTHRSQDGVTWTTISQGALDVGVDISGTTGSGSDGYEVGRLRMAFSGGQCLLVAHLVANDTDPNIRDQIGQWASTSRATSFQTIEVGGSIDTGGDELTFSHHSVIEYNGRLIVTFPTRELLVIATALMRIELPTATAPISSRVANLFQSGGVIAFNESGDGRIINYDATNNVVTDGDCTVHVDEDGTWHCVGRLVNGSATNKMGAFMVSSTTGGERLTWEYHGNTSQADSALVCYTGDAATYLSDFVSVAHRGRQLLIGTSTTDVTSSTTLGALFLGGASTVTLPAPINHPRIYQRSGWTESYLPFELPGNWNTLVNSGAGTDAISTAGLLQRTTSANTRVSYWTPTSTIAQGLVVRYALTVSSGGSLATDACCIKIRTADGTDDYEVTIRFSTSSFRMWDDNAGAQVGTDKSAVAPSGGIEVLAALVNGEFSCWFRALGSTSDREWTAAIQGSSLTDDTGTPTGSNRILFGANATDTGVHTVQEVHYMAGSRTAGALGAGFTNPDDLFGRTLARRGRTIGIDDGVRLTAIDGSAMEGDTFHVDTAYEHPIERILYRESPSPRSAWRSVAVSSGNVAEQLIPFVLNPDATTLGSEEQGFGQTLCYASFAGVNWSAGSIERWDVGTAAWVEVVTITNLITTAFSLTRRGSELIVPSLPTTSSGRYFYENECAGWTVALGSTYRKILGNTAGTLATNISGPKPVFYLADIDGSEPTTTTVSLIPDSFAVTFHTDGETGGGWALRIDAQPTADNDLRIGHLSMGRVFVFGTQYGRGRVAMYESGDLTEDTPSGVRRARRAGPGGRTVRLAWPDPIDTTQTQGATANPDWLLSTATAGNLANAAQKDVPFSVLGLLENVGARDAITYLPCISLTSDTVHYRFSDAFMIGTITSAAQIESVVGEECDPTGGEAFRVATVVVEEIR